MLGNRTLCIWNWNWGYANNYVFSPQEGSLALSKKQIQFSNQCQCILLLCHYFLTPDNWTQNVRYLYEFSTLKNETIVTCGRRLCPAFHTHSSRESYQKLSNCSPNVPIGMAYNAYSRIVVSSNLGSLICDTSQFIAFSADELPVAANAFSLKYFKHTTIYQNWDVHSKMLKISFYRFQIVVYHESNFVSSYWTPVESHLVYRNLYIHILLTLYALQCPNALIFETVFSLLEQM